MVELIRFGKLESLYLELLEVDREMLGKMGGDSSVANSNSLYYVDFFRHSIINLKSIP